jgi:cytochrome c peroxidase
LILQTKYFRLWMLLCTVILILLCGSFTLHAVTPKQGLVDLGRDIFFDKRLSTNGQVSCASCHQPDRVFADGLAVSKGVGGKSGTRNAPSLLGVANQTIFFWDGRRNSLAEQVLDPFINPVEHGFRTHAELIEVFKKDANYVSQFRRAFADRSSTIDHRAIADALVAYLTSLSPAESPFERYQYKNEKSALTPLQAQGLGLFNQAGCASCHLIEKSSAPLADGKFHSVGVGLDRIVGKLPALSMKVKTGDARAIDHAIVNDAELAELGRFLVTSDPKDIGKFKTPSLRNAALTAPYMHDGSVATLEEALDRELYYRALEIGKPTTLTVEEKSALLAFLRSL